MSIGTYGLDRIWLSLVALFIRLRPGAALASFLARMAHDSSVSGPGSSVSGTFGERAAAVASRVSRPPGWTDCTNAGRTRPAGSFAGSSAMGHTHDTLSGSLMGSPWARGVLATRWVTKLETRSPLSGSRSSISTGNTPVFDDRGMGRRRRFGSRGALGSWSGRFSTRPPTGEYGRVAA